jgi:predicted O-methyltransferase YrrM
MIMDEYAAWGKAGRNHASGAFGTSTLRQIEEHIARMNIDNSAETGCGKSTILLSNYSKHHTIFTYDDRHLGERSSMNFFLDCPLTKANRLTYVFGPTQKTLPAYTKHQPYDLVLIDGPHGYPFPEMEYYHFYQHIKPNGVLILDDLHIPTIGRLADFIAEDDMFEVVALISATAIFRRTDAQLFDPAGDGWFMQKYNRRRVSRRRDFFLPSENVVDRFTSLQLDKAITGD